MDLDNNGNQLHSSSRRRSRRVHSWYMYEQYKSLERNQAEAARKLNEKWSQDILLHHEMSEHRERRRMCNACHSEPSVDFFRHGAAHSCDPSISDLFPRFCQDDEFANADDVISTHDSCRWNEDDREPHTEPSRWSEPSSMPLPRTVLETSIGHRSSCMSNLADDIEQAFSIYDDDKNLLRAPSTGYLTADKEVAPELYKRSSGSSEAKRYEDSIPLTRSVLNSSTGHISSCTSNNIPEEFEPVFSTYDDKNLLLASPTSNLTDDRAELLSVSNSKHANDDALPPADSNSNLADDIKEAMEFVKKIIAENIQHQLEMKENVKSLEGLTNVNDSKYMGAFTFGDKNVNVTDDDENQSLRLHRKLSSGYMTNLNSALWAKFVSFAYQLVQLNHGNCYHDYSSLLMTGVLACDVVRRGIRLVWNVLQPYVSPIKYVSNSTISDLRNSTNSIKTARNTRTTLPQLPKKIKSTFKFQKNHMRSHKISRPIKSLRRGETASGEKVCWAEMATFDNSPKTVLQNEAWQSLSTYPSVTLPSEKQSSTWYQELNSKGSFNSCSTRVTNPMLNIATYIDSIVEFDGNPNL
ncbi:hypothetical protein O0L34_g5020 [Tuta absoluta]|nr:hypothetical protein O0L34_g5020 [Tuta absoluta]